MPMRCARAGAAASARRWSARRNSCARMCAKAMSRSEPHGIITAWCSIPRRWPSTLMRPMPSARRRLRFIAAGSSAKDSRCTALPRPSYPTNETNTRQSPAFEFPAAAWCRSRFSTRMNCAAENRYRGAMAALLDESLDERRNRFAGEVAGRIEPLPLSSWQVRTRIIIGTATFFDAFDALSIAYILPVIVPLWKLTPQETGFLISAGFFGQLFGALFFGWYAERYGRMKALVASIATFAILSFACAFSWDYASLLILRTLQGFGLGGEVPIAATYIGELAKAKGRGRFVLLFELVFPFGILAASLLGLWMVPTFGWQSMFFVGAIPAVLVLFLQRMLPESPRWLAARGRYADAEAALHVIEAC